MNIVTPYPSNIPINNVNITTEAARRDNQLREVIAKPAAAEAAVRERGVANELDKARPGQPNPNQFEGNLRDAENAQKIHERSGGHQQEGQGEQGQNEQAAEQQAKQAAQDQAEQKVAELDLKQVQQLKSRDAEVRSHEAAHAAAGGQYAGSPTYSFKRGPDGNNYATAGEVSIDASRVPGDPAGTITKMLQVRAAALAPAQPSSQDRKVAGLANQSISEARATQAKETAAEIKEAAAQKQAKTDESKETETLKADKAKQSDEAKAVSDPFNLLGSDDDEAIAINGSNSDRRGAFGEVFGVSGQNGQVNQASNNTDLNALGNDKRNSEVVARAARVQNFYQGSTRPQSAGGFSQFA
ncbi:MAG: hypothetical protein ACI8WB_001623 [Phenylobacterium sp.]|jgi:hypothetical protein